MARWQDWLVPSEVRDWSLGREFIAGLANFLTAGYIIAVHPDILSTTGMDRHALIAVTCYASALGCFLMAFWPKVPIMMAPGMGLNAFFAFTICGIHKVPWTTALGIVFLAGVLFIGLTVGGLREAILRAIPLSLRLAIPAGIGLFIAFIGLQHMKLIVDHPATLVTLGPLRKELGLALAGLVVACTLEALRVRGSLLIVILAITLIAISAGWVERPTAWVTRPPSIEPVFLKMNVREALQPIHWLPIFAFMYVALFDGLGTLTGIAYQAGLARNGEIPRLGRMLMADAVGATAGAILGTSTVTAYIESGAGVAAGGRTGWTALFTGLFFLLAPFFSGLIAVIPSYATAIALVVVGIYMIQHIREIDFTRWDEGAPAFLTIVLMPLTYSIATGLCFGILSYLALVLLLRRWERLSPTLVLISLLSALYLYLSTRGLAHA
ncbi:MAG: NCS2 family permease [Acidobacteria bacterium]|nr:NCS2 family permease [Acidobacteriota bacterium]MDW7983663.1 NCS2 family permease [Acidobacteriota bacterium]